MSLTTKKECVSVAASGDLSSNQFRIVYIDDNGRVAVNTGVATPNFGILMNKPSALGQAAEVAVRGSIVKMEAGAAINERDAIRAVAGGRGSMTNTNNDYIIGRALTAAAGSGSLFEVEVDPDRYNA